MQKDEIIYDVLGIGNAIVDVLAKVVDGVLTERGLNKGSMTLLGAREAGEIYRDIIPEGEVSGGAVQAGEDSKVAVVREIREETGLDVSNCPDGYRFTYRRDNPDEGDNYFVDVYRFELDFNESDLKLQEEETMGYRLATLDEIKELDKQGIFLHYSSIKKVFE